jgi:hypothetical protein
LPNKDRETLKNTTLAIAGLRFLFLVAKIWPTPDASGSAIAISNSGKRLSRS